MLTKPKIILRSEWGSRQTKKADPHTPCKITIHHSGGNLTVKEMQDMHIDRNKWLDIGYHYVVDKKGNIYQGRPVETVGAHVQGFNVGNVGVCLIGNFQTEKSIPAQVKAAEQMMAWLCYVYEISVSNIYKHSDLVPTACPGTNIASIFPKIKNDVQEMLLEAKRVVPTPAPAPKTPAVKPEDKYDDLIKKYSNVYGLEVALLKALVKQESNFNSNAVSGSGAQGLTQLMPATAKEVGVTNAFDPEQAIWGGARYLSTKLREMKDYFKGKTGEEYVVLALASYNAGAGNVKKYGGIPLFSETQNYVKKILEYRAEFQKAEVKNNVQDGNTKTTNQEKIGVKEIVKDGQKQEGTAKREAVQKQEVKEKEEIGEEKSL